MADALASGASVRKDVGVQVPPRPQLILVRFSFIVQQLTELRRSQNLLWNLTLRELRSKYRRSFLGWAWSMLNPLSNMVIYWFVFGVVFGATAPTGDPSGIQVYALYLLTGILPWGFFALVTNLGLGSLLGNSGLVKKVYFAWETLVFAQVIFSFVQFCIEMTLLCVALLIVGSPIAPWIPIAFLLMLLLAVYAAGFALALSTLAVYFRDLRYLWTIIIQVMFFATPIIYTPDKIAGKVPPILEFILHWNPMAVFVLSFRHLLYSGRAPEWGHIAYLVAASILAFVGGWTIFVKQSRRLAEEL
jgi:ABC-type polysaccharide/polyol phosphate export permease